MNSIAKTIFIIGVITIFGGVLLGFLNLEQVVGYEDSTLGNGLGDPIIKNSWTTFLTYTISGFVIGFLLIGIGEVINLLDKNKKLSEGILKKQ
ncbi:hypothetical protein ACFFGV_19490 [Pontibacillus salicampi]|uniref:Uncharacterized protein n=1 Tax=Pontibacillus salicampi TaxID=1449801 RepID=A0ABV6LTM5_9BACI